MKIILISNLYGEYSRGGAERIVRIEAEGLMAAGHDVTVITGVPKSVIPKGICSTDFPADCPPPPGQEDMPHGRIAFARNTPRVLKYYPPNIYFYSDDVRHGFVSRLVWHAIDTFNRASAAKLSRILRQERPDVVHTHNLMGLGFFVPDAIARLRIRHVHTVHDVQLIRPSGLLRPGSSGGAAGAISSAITRKLFASPAAVVFPSEFLERLHARLGFFPDSRRVVLRHPAPDVGPERRVPTTPTFLFAGQLAPHKGIRTLMDAWRISGAANGARLVIAGAGRLEREIRSKASSSSHVTFAGKLEPDALMSAYREAAFIVVPSLVAENAPAVIIEAMSQGTPVIASDAGGIPELAREGENGLLVRPGNAMALADALRRAASLAGWKGMSDASRRAAALLPLDAHLRELERLYQGVQ